MASGRAARGRGPERATKIGLGRDDRRSRDRSLRCGRAEGIAQVVSPRDLDGATGDRGRGLTIDERVTQAERLVASGDRHRAMDGSNGLASVPAGPVSPAVPGAVSTAPRSNPPTVIIPPSPCATTMPR